MVDILVVGGVAYFAVHMLNIVGYSEHKRAYEVTNTALSVTFVHPSSLLYHEPLTVTKTASETGLIIIKPRIDLYPMLVD